MGTYEALKQLLAKRWLCWYIREVSAAMLCANLTVFGTLLQRFFGPGQQRDGIQLGKITPRTQPSAGPLLGGTSAAIPALSPHIHTARQRPPPNPPTSEHEPEAPEPLVIPIKTDIRIESRPETSTSADRSSRRASMFNLEGPLAPRSIARPTSDATFYSANSTARKTSLDSQAPGVVTRCYHVASEGEEGNLEVTIVERDEN
jgi:hypothetical protein